MRRLFRKRDERPRIPYRDLNLILREAEVSDATHCSQCGMLTTHPREFHPYAACLMMQASGDGRRVRANLEFVIDRALLAGRESMRREVSGE